jgi:hypothetical protein
MTTTIHEEQADNHPVNLKTAAAAAAGVSEKEKGDDVNSVGITKQTTPNKIGSGTVRIKSVHFGEL